MITMIKHIRKSHTESTSAGLCRPVICRAIYGFRPCQRYRALHRYFSKAPDRRMDQIGGRLRLSIGMIYASTRRNNGGVRITGIAILNTPGSLL